MFKTIYKVFGNKYYVILNCPLKDHSHISVCSRLNAQTDQSHFDTDKKKGNYQNVVVMLYDIFSSSI